MTRILTPLQWLAFCLILLVGCGKNESTSPASLFAGVYLVPAVEADGPLLLFSRFEITRAEFEGTSDPDLRELPAVMLTQREAMDWAEQHGMRLPTRAEWLQARSSGLPPSQEWGRANTLELGLGRALPVGAFESGRTGLGGYDFDGNVWEWLAPEAEAQGADAIQAGGSFASYRATDEEQRFRPASAELRASDVGFRPVAEAIPWLAQVALPVFRNATEEERRAMELELDAWSRDLRFLLVSRWRLAYPDELEFAKLLEPAETSS